MTPKEIRSRRLALALSVDELARLLEIAPETMRAIESGDLASMPDADALERAFTRLESEKRRHQ